MLSNKKLKNLGQTLEKRGKEFHHDLEFVEKSADQDKEIKPKWIKKTATSAVDAYKELIAQELLRLFFPWHPKTRLVIDENNLAIISKQIVNFNLIERKDRQKIKKFKELIKQNIITGFGQILVFAVWLKENDFKLPNLGYNENNQLIKIDGEQSFINIRNQAALSRDFTIREETIKYLPFNKGYQSSFWLDQIIPKQVEKNGKLMIERNKRFDETDTVTNRALINASCIIPLDFMYDSGHNKGFDQEINSTILQIALMSDGLITTFINSYLDVIGPEFAQEIISSLIEGRDQYINSTLELDSFRNYIFSEQAQTDAIKFAKLLQNFKSYGKIQPFDETTVKVLQDRNNMLVDKYKNHTKKNISVDFFFTSLTLTEKNNHAVVANVDGEETVQVTKEDNEKTLTALNEDKTIEQVKTDIDHSVNQYSKRIKSDLDVSSPKRYKPVSKVNNNNDLFFVYQPINDTFKYALDMALMGLDLKTSIEDLIIREDNNTLNNDLPKELQHDHTEDGKIKRIQYHLCNMINSQSNREHTPHFKKIVEQEISSEYKNVNHNINDFIRECIINHSSKIKLLK